MTIDTHLQTAAREMIASEQDLAKHYSIEQLTEHVRILAKRLKLAGELKAQTED